jgi:3-keto-disaccharide hydrolase
MMKTRKTKLIALALITILLAPGFTMAQSKSKKTKGQNNSKSEKIQLFNGKDLNNWTFYLKDQNVDPTTVFTIQNSVINISGSPFGYMRTKEIYSDYKLHVEWRWPNEATNSGVFVHGQKPDAIWLKCIECQLKDGNAGDFVCMNGADMTEHTDKSNLSVKKLAPSSEKPTGKWNTMEVVCKGNTIEVFVNGVMQNKGTNVTVSEGSICLQSEGKAIEFRNIYILKKKN